MPYPRRGGAGSGFPLGLEQNTFDAGTGDKAAAETLRDNYATANPSWLAYYTNNQGRAINLIYEGAGGKFAERQTYSGTEWITQVEVEGLPGPVGPSGEGSVPPFESEAARDTFFGTVGNRLFLKSGLPIEVNVDGVVTNYIWSGPSNPQDYVADDSRWRVAPFRVSNGSLLVGPDMTISNGQLGIEILRPDELHGELIQTLYTSSGSQIPKYPKLAAEDTLNINTTSDQTITMPFGTAYTTVGNNKTIDFGLIPAVAGDLRAVFRETDASGEVIFDEVRNFTQAEVDAGQPVPFGVGNRYRLPQGQQLYVTFTGVDLKGGVAGPDDLLSGQTTPYFVSVVQPYTEINMLTADDNPIVSASRVATGLQLTSVNGSVDVVPVGNLRYVYPNLGQGGTPGTTIQLDNINGTLIHLHEDAGNTNGIVIANVNNLANDGYFEIDASAITSDITLSVVTANYQFRGGVTSIDVKAGSIIEFFAHSRLNSAPSPTNPLVIYDDVLGDGAGTSVPIDTGALTYYLDINSTNTIFSGNRAFPFTTLAQAFEEARVPPSGNHKHIVSLGSVNLGDITNTSTTGNVGNLIFDAFPAVVGDVTLQDHATTLQCRVINGNVNIGDQCNITSHNFGSATAKTVTFTSEVHDNTGIRARRFESTVSIDFSNAQSGSVIICQIDHYEGNISTAIQSIPAGVTVEGWIGDTALPTQKPVLANFDGLPEYFDPSMIRRLEDSFDVVFDVTNRKHTTSYTVIAQRGTVAENLSSSNLAGTTEGRNTGQVVFTDADITALAGGSGNIEVRAQFLEGGSAVTLHLATILERDDGIITLANAETANYQVDPQGGNNGLWELEGAFVTLDSGSDLNIEDAGRQFEFTCKLLGDGTGTVAGLNGATVNVPASQSANDIWRVVRTASNTYEAFKVN